MSAAPHRIEAGAVLFRPGDPCRGFVVLHEGTLRVTLTAASGREIVLYRVSRGDICLQTFSCLVEGRDYAACGIAETPLMAEVIPAVDFHRRLSDDSEFRRQVFSAVAQRFSDFERLVEDVALTGFTARLARALLRLANADGKVVATHEQLAVETGSGRAVVSRQLARFAAANLVGMERGQVSLLDWDALADIADDV